MRSFQVIAFLFALVACAFAVDTQSYDSTVYITSTVYRVNTITMSGSSSAAPNSTSTISASHASVASSYPAITGVNSSATVRPTASGPSPSASPFTGAASSLSINAYVAAVAAGLCYLAL